jgi:hypothetical protein
MIDKEIRFRLFEVYKILYKTSENSPVSIKQIIDLINTKNNMMIPISDRRAIYKDIDAIMKSGILNITRKAIRHNIMLYWRVNDES